MSEEQKKKRTKHEKDLETCRTERDEYLEGWKRAKADLINYRQEEEERTGSLLRSMKEGLMRDLITVLDSFHLGVSTSTDEMIEKKGVELIHNQLNGILEKQGLQRIEVDVGDMFDPTIHEAVAEMPSDQKPGTIIQEIEAGYRLHDKILRPSRVVVAKETHT